MLNNIRVNWCCFDSICTETETTNIASRVCHWRRIVNEKTEWINARLNLFIPQNLLPKFEWTEQDFAKYIQFVIQWNGLKMKQIKNSPANYAEYERKARNWLNGRRAPNYAGTLFPDMVRAAQQVCLQLIYNVQCCSSYLCNPPTYL